MINVWGPWIRKLEEIKKRKAIKKLTTTLTDSQTDEVSDQTPTAIEVITNKIKNSGTLTLTEISLLMSDLFDEKAITSTTQKLQENLIRDAIFIMSSVNTTLETTDRVPNTLTFVMKEITYDLEMTITVNADCFHDVFKSIDLTNINRTGDNNDT